MWLGDITKGLYKKNNFFSCFHVPLPLSTTVLQSIMVFRLILHVHTSALNIQCYTFISLAYIAPLSHTLVDFWRMVWQERVQTIVMLNSSAEGKLKKSEIYWPEVGTREYGPFMLTLVECQVFADYTIRTMHLVVSEIA